MDGANFDFDDDDEMDEVKPEQSQVKPEQPQAPAAGPLQALLFACGAKRNLMKHQLDGVLRNAGLPSDWPPPQSTWPTAGPPLPPQGVQNALRGVLLADEMGLGKTATCLNAIPIIDYRRAQQGLPELPALAVVPSEAVLQQWKDEATGEHGCFSPEQVVSTNCVGTIGKLLVAEVRPKLILIDKNKLQAHNMKIFTSLRAKPSIFDPSPLAPHTEVGTVQNLHASWVAYSSSKSAIKLRKDRLYTRGTERDASNQIGMYHTGGKTIEDVMKRQQQKQADQLPIFSIVFFDEAHELKNALAHWTMMAMQVALHAERVVAVSGSFFADSLQDMATMHKILDPSNEWATLQKWKWAYEPAKPKLGNHGQVLETVQQVEARQLKEREEWKRQWMLRRTIEQIDELKLPEKKVVTHELQLAPLEMGLSIELEIGAVISGGHEVHVTIEAAGGANGPAKTKQLGKLSGTAKSLVVSLGLLREREHKLQYKVLREGNVVATKEVPLELLLKQAYSFREITIIQQVQAATAEEAQATAMEGGGQAAEEAKTRHEAASERLLKATKELDQLQLADGVVLQPKLTCVDVPGGYLSLEKKLLKAFKAFAKAAAAESEAGGSQARRQAARQELKIAFDIMIQTAVLCKLATVHPVLPKLGSEITTCFGTRKVKKLMQFCASCNPLASGVTIHKSPESQQQRLEELAEDEEDELDGDEQVEQQLVAGAPEQLHLGALGITICRKACGGHPHHACAGCAQSLAEDGADCPRCAHLIERLHVGTKADPFFDEELACVETPLWDGKSSGGVHMTPKLAQMKEIVLQVGNTSKILIFSQFTTVLDLASGVIKELKIGCVRIDGTVPTKERPAVLEQFRKEDDIRVLLMTLKTGGVGLNLQAADTIITFDRGWNHVVHDQAEARAHRMGQTKDVTVHYLDTALTFDAAARALMDDKRTNSKVILDPEDDKEVKTNDDKDPTDKEVQGYKRLAGRMGEELRKCVAQRAGMPMSELFPEPSTGTGSGKRKLAAKQPAAKVAREAAQQAGAQQAGAQQAGAHQAAVPQRPSSRKPNFGLAQASSQSLEPRTEMRKGEPNSLPLDRQVRRRLKDVTATFSDDQIWAALGAESNDVTVAARVLREQAPGQPPKGPSAIIIISDDDDDMQVTMQVPKAKTQAKLRAKAIDVE